MMHEKMDVDALASNDKRNWLGTLGVMGFLFFLIKGLVWLGAAAFLLL